MSILYSITLGWSAFLLFYIQPILGKMLLPHFGGTPAVWNLCMFFFQAMLLGGYFYAHRFAMMPRQKLAKTAHLLFLLVAVLYCIFWQKPFSLPSELMHPNRLLLSALFIYIGLPFLLLSTTASLLQNWYAQAKPNQDPYFLYSASNLGSLTALILYPLLLEPILGVGEQMWLWRAGFAVLLFMIGICAWLGREKSLPTSPKPILEPLKWKQKSYWLLLAFLPSSLLIGTTNYLSTDIASLPLLWVIPLILYLLSFILTFSPYWQNKIFLHPFYLGRASAFLGSISLLGIILESNQPGWIFFPAHLILFFLLSLLCHQQLAKSRPHPQHLTTFYLCLSLGGVLGGFVNSLLAPQFLPGLIEYPLAFLWATALRPGKFESSISESSWQKDIFYAFAVSAFLLLLVFFAKKLGLQPGRLNNLFVLGLPMILVYRQVTQPRRFALAAISVFLCTFFAFSGRGHHLLYSERNFFGISKVVTDKGDHQLFFHGSTLHGQQAFAPEKRQEPLAYFSRLGPMGEIFSAIRKEKFQRIGVVGLGIGTLAAYAEPKDSWTFFELDPAVLHIARDTNYFTYLQNSKAKETNYILGDARIKLAELPDNSFDVLILDAFTSDAIPTHLITLEALNLYWQKLRPDGMLVFNISNRYFSFATLLANLAQATDSQAKLKELNVADGSQEDKAGAASSSWIVMSKNKNLTFPSWETVKPTSQRIWTDQFSNLFSLLQFTE